MYSSSCVNVCVAMKKYLQKNCELVREREREREKQRVNKGEMKRLFEGKQRCLPFVHAGLHVFLQCFRSCPKKHCAGLHVFAAGPAEIHPHFGSLTAFVSRSEGGQATPPVEVFDTMGPQFLMFVDTPSKHHMMKNQQSVRLS